MVRLFELKDHPSYGCDFCGRSGVPMAHSPIELAKIPGLRYHADICEDCARIALQSHFEGKETG